MCAQIFDDFISIISLFAENVIGANISGVWAGVRMCVRTD